MNKRGHGEICTYCRRSLESTTSRSRIAATKDHIVPVAQYGTRTVWCCRQCNEIKGAMSISHWEKFMVENPEWWKLEQFRHFGVGYKRWTPAQVGPIESSWLRDLYSWSRKNSLPLARTFFHDR